MTNFVKVCKKGRPTKPKYISRNVYWSMSSGQAVFFFICAILFTLLLDSRLFNYLDTGKIGTLFVRHKGDDV